MASPSPGEHYLSSHWKMFSEAALQMARRTPRVPSPTSSPFPHLTQQSPLRAQQAVPPGRSIFLGRQKGLGSPLGSVGQRPAAT